MRYRIVPDEFTLCVEEKHVKGKASKSPGEVYWVKTSWPGRLLDTAEWLLDRLTVENAKAADVTDVVGLVEAIKAAKAEVREIVADYTGVAV